MSLLTAARSTDAVVDALRKTTRATLGADGIAVILRQNERCHYVAEDALSPLWTGQDFAIAECVSGIAMMTNTVISIPDIFQDPRVPQDAYAPTFVRSMAMAPIGAPTPVAALGVYWAELNRPDAATIAILTRIAAAATQALANIADADKARANEATLHAVLESTSDCFYAVDEDWRIVSFNRASEAYFNLGRNEVIGRSLWELFPAGEKRPFGDYCRRAMHDREHVTFEAASAFRPGNTVEIRMAPMAGGISVSLTDITERRRAENEVRTLMKQLEQRVAAAVSEREAALRQLHESQKIEALGQITGGVAHDFNNLLSPILGGLELLKRRGLNHERAHALIDAAQESAERARVLVQRLLAFARRQPLRLEAVDLRELLEGMRDLLQTSLGARIRLEIVAENALPSARADANQLELALLNLAVNARDAMPEGGVLRITLDTATDPDDLAPGPYLRLVVADDGVGMDAETKKRATEPFFSTKGIGQGTGLGLSMAHGLAAQLGGRLDIDSAPGEGARITILLPPARTAPLAKPQPAASPALPKAGIALLVDDEPSVRSLTSEMLQELGFVVEEARNAEEALARIAQGLKFEWLVTDHMMPGMSGADLARRVSASHPDTRILIISGYAELDAIAPDLPRLAKPFLQAELARALVGD